MKFTLAILICLNMAFSTLAFCPLPYFVRPCTCREDAYGVTLDCTDISGDWDIRETFESIASRIPDDAVFDYLGIHNTGITTLQEGDTATLKFKDVQLSWNEQLTFIHPDAFKASAGFITKFAIANCPIVNDVEEWNFYNLINKFTKLEIVEIYETSLTSIPANAFKEISTLREIDISNCPITAIGNFAFSGSQNLEKVKIARIPNLKLAGIAQDALSGLPQGVKAALSETTFEYLDESKFRGVLDVVSEDPIYGGLVVGGIIDCEPWGPCTYYEFTCDANVQWLCDNAAQYKNKLKGYKCIGSSDLEDIFQSYCV